MKNIEKNLKNVEKIKISKIPPVKIFVLCIPFRSQKHDFFKAVWPTDSEKPWNGAAYYRYYNSVLYVVVGTAA